MISICHLTSVHKSHDVRILLKECTSLAKAGYEVNLIAVNTTDEMINGVRIISINDPGGGRIRRAGVVCNEIFKKALELNSEIYHIHDPELLRIGWKLIKKGKKVIYDVHEDLPRQIEAKAWIPALFRKLTSVIAEKLEDRYARKMTGVVAATPFIRDRFLKINPRTIDVNNFPMLAEFIQIEKSVKQSNEICYAGALTESRGIYQLMKALENTNARLNLAGKFEDEKIEKDIKKSPAWNQVNYYGFVERKEILAIYSRSVVGIVTLLPLKNYLDALPVKMFEYMGAGIPVVASDFPYWKSILLENNCGITVNPLNPEEITKAILFFLSNPDEAARMGENGKKAVLEKFNWEMEEKKLLALYQMIIQN